MAARRPRRETTQVPNPPARSSNIQAQRARRATPKASAKRGPRPSGALPTATELAQEFQRFVNPSHGDPLTCPASTLFTPLPDAAWDRRALMDADLAAFPRGVCCPVPGTGATATCAQDTQWKINGGDACTVANHLPRTDVLGMYARAAQDRVRAVCNARCVRLDAIVRQQGGPLPLSGLQEMPFGGLGLIALTAARLGTTLARYICEVKPTHLFEDTPYSIDVTPGFDDLTADLSDVSVPFEAGPAMARSKRRLLPKTWAAFATFGSRNSSHRFVPPMAQMANEPGLEGDANATLEWEVGCRVDADLQTGFQAFSASRAVLQKGLVPRQMREALRRGQRVFIVGLLLSTRYVSKGEPITWCYADGYEEHRRRAGYTACHASPEAAHAAQLALAPAVVEPVVAHAWMLYKPVLVFRLASGSVYELSDFLVESHQLPALYDYFATAAPSLQREPCAWPMWVYLCTKYSPALAAATPFPGPCSRLTPPPSRQSSAANGYTLVAIFGHEHALDGRLGVFLEWDGQEGYVTREFAEDSVYSRDGTQPTTPMFAEYVRQRPSLIAALPDYVDAGSDRQPSRQRSAGKPAQGAAPALPSHDSQRSASSDLRAPLAVAMDSREDDRASSSVEPSPPAPSAVQGARRDASHDVFGGMGDRGQPESIGAQGPLDSWRTLMVPVGTGAGQVPGDPLARDGLVTLGFGNGQPLLAGVMPLPSHEAWVNEALAAPNRANAQSAPFRALPPSPHELWEPQAVGPSSDEIAWPPPPRDSAAWSTSAEEYGSASDWSLSSGPTPLPFRVPWTDATATTTPPTVAWSNMPYAWGNARSAWDFERVDARADEGSRGARDDSDDSDDPDDEIDFGQPLRFRSTASDDDQFEIAW